MVNIRIPEREHRIDLSRLHKHSGINAQMQYVSLLERLNTKYGRLPEQTEIVSVQSSAGSDVMQPEYLKFDEDAAENERKVRTLFSRLDQLKSDYDKVLDQDIAGNAVYYKTIDNLKNKLRTFLGKGNFSVNVIKKEIQRSIPATIIKNYANPALKDPLDRYFKDCGFRKVDFGIGKKLEDKDMDYLSSTPRYAPVDSPEKHNTVIEVIHDAFVYDCYDAEEDEFYSKNIPAEYIIGSWKA